MIAYLDTSSLVKLYVEEHGSADVLALVKSAEAVATSRVAYVEAMAAFVRRLAATRPTKAYSQTKEAFLKDWPDYLIIEVVESVSSLAANLAEKHRLRGFDSLHLASAVFLKNRVSRPIVFSSADKKLNEAARKEGLKLLAL